MDYLDNAINAMTDGQQATQIKKARRSRIIKERQAKIKELLAKCPQYIENDEA